MTPREAIALQRQRPQLPSGWRVPDHPANRWEPRRAPEPVALPRVPSTVIIKPDSAPARMLALFRDLARHGHCLPYYRELSVRVGVPVKNLNAPFERLESEGLIMRVVRPRPGKGQADWAVRLVVEGVKLCTPSGWDLEP